MDGRISRHKRTLKSDREVIIRMWLEGTSARDISIKTGISISTIHRWVRRWREEGTVDTRSYYSRQWAAMGGGGGGGAVVACKRSSQLTGRSTTSVNKSVPLSFIPKSVYDKDNSNLRRSSPPDKRGTMSEMDVSKSHMLSFDSSLLAMNAELSQDNLSMLLYSWIITVMHQVHQSIRSVDDVKEIDLEAIRWLK
ncbi:hypothetical protein Pcinc_019587 [Petrolisthes cinctipes]|uniref:Homeodomain-like DNA binding domain-containing transcription factor n=1 Tax=Petrolisthes cinctipes TaxID=88211 RepID=A0AAE1FPK3_PETCI|nr:hypothetical protein Pcinc_019587 [Petrolisthes cinctipes]